MKAMILAAGLGTRLRPLTNTCPKPLLTVRNYPLVVWNLFLLRKYGIREVIVNVHYLGEQIQTALGDGHQWGMRISYSVEPVLLGTGGGIKQVESFFEGEPFLVLNGDTLMDIDLTQLRRFHERRQDQVTMVLRDDPAVESWGAVEVDEEKRIVTINGRGWMGKRHGVVTRLMFAGVHIIHPSILSVIPKGTSTSIIDAYTAWLAQGAKMSGYLFSGYWSDVGTPERYAQVQRDVEAGLLVLPQ